MTNEQAFEAIIQHYENITFLAQLGIASSILNIICWCVLIYATLKLRRATKNLREATRMMVKRQP